MPTAGTHITLIERLALDPQFTPLLGDPLADETDPAGLQMRYAKLGAIGPDLFYALMDYGGEMQDLVNFFAKYSGAVECMGHAMHDLEAFGTKVSSDVTFGASNAAKQTLDEIGGVVKNTMAIVKEMAVVVVTDSYNFFTIFEAKRQKDKARTEWFWADYLHYVRSGRFVSALFEGAGDDPNLRAYAYGYLSHYVTDVIGHPFVNQVVGAPFRMYWQRHHLVENFMDGYVWDRWHDAHPAPPLPSIEEAPLDTIRATPHQQIWRRPIPILISIKCSARSESIRENPAGTRARDRSRDRSERCTGSRNQCARARACRSQVPFRPDPRHGSRYAVDGIYLQARAGVCRGAASCRQRASRNNWTFFEISGAVSSASCKSMWTAPD